MPAAFRNPEFSSELLASCCAIVFCTLPSGSPIVIMVVDIEVGMLERFELLLFTGSGGGCSKLLCSELLCKSSVKSSDRSICPSRVMESDCFLNVLRFGKTLNHNRK